MGSCCLLWVWRVQRWARNPEPWRTGQSLPAVSSPSPRSIPRPFRGILLEFGAKFFKSQSSDSRWLPARITRLDAEFRRLDLQDRGIWNLEVGRAQYPKPGG